MSKNETAYSKPTIVETAFSGVSKVETAQTATSKSETGYVGVNSDGITYDDTTFDYNAAIIEYNGKTKMAKYKDAYAGVTKIETAYA